MLQVFLIMFPVVYREILVLSMNLSIVAHSNLGFHLRRCREIYRHCSTCFFRFRLAFKITFLHHLATGVICSLSYILELQTKFVLQRLQYFFHHHRPQQRREDTTLWTSSCGGKCYRLFSYVSLHNILLLKAALHI